MDEWITVAGAIGGGVWAGRKVLGPSLDTVGKNLAELVDWRKNNARRIAEHAERISQANGTAEDAYVHPRVAERFVDDLSWIDDELMQRYSGGLLAAARSDGGEDDRAIRYLNIISDMTKTETLLHFLLYRAYYDYFRAFGGLNNESSFWRYQVNAPVAPLLTQLFPGITDLPRAFYNLREALAGLAQHGLLLEMTTHVESPPESRSPDGRAPLSTFKLRVNGTGLGATMFMQARGVSDSNPDAIAISELPQFSQDEPVLQGTSVVVSMS